MKKILLIGACIALILMLGIRCFAAYPMPNIDGICTTEYPYFTVVGYYSSWDGMDGDHHVMLLATKQPLVVHQNDYGFDTVYANNGFTKASLIGSLSNGSWQVDDASPSSSLTVSSTENNIEIYNTNYDIYDANGDLYQAKNYDFVPEKPLDIYENVGEISSKIGGVSTTLVTVGLGIMAIFIGVALVPRIVHKFF